MLAKDAGLYFKDNHDNKCFDEKQWEAIKAWTKLSNNKSINKKASQNLYRFIREVSDSDYRTDKFWSKEPDYRDYTFDYLKEWCGLDLPNGSQKKHWFWILKRNFKPGQTRNFIRLLRRYGQKTIRSRT